MKSIPYYRQKLDFNCFDIEVYPNYWEIRSETWYYQSSDEFGTPQNTNLKRLNTNLEVIRQVYNEILVGYNVKHYDNIILYHILYENDNVDYIYELSSKIIETHGILDISYWNKLKFVDLIDFAKNANDDKRIGLKSIAANVGLNIMESEIDFTTNITKENYHLHDKYLENDVIVTKDVFERFESMVDIKLNVAQQFKIDRVKALKSTMTKIATTILYNGDETEFDETLIFYKIPEQLKYIIQKYVPYEIINYYLQTPMHEIKGLEFEDFGNKGKFGKGGIHSQIKDDYYAETNDDYIVGHDDFVSYYPNIMIIYDLLSRKCNKNLYIDLYKERLRIKELLGYNQDNYDNRRIYDTYKEIINAVFGASGDKYSDIYDFEMIFSVTITGQLLLYAVAKMMYENGIKIIQTNTDGLVVEHHPSKLAKRQEICKYITDLCGIELESENIKKFVNFNVNTYIEIDEHDNLVTKGALVNNSRATNMFSTRYPIEHKAIIEYMINNVPISETLKSSNDIKDFTAVLQVGYTYKDSYYGSFEYIKYKVQKVNRIINVNDSNYIIYKKKDDKNPEKLPNQSDGVIIINGNIEDYNFDDFDINYEFHYDRVIKVVEKIKEHKDERY